MAMKRHVKAMEKMFVAEGMQVTDWKHTGGDHNRFTLVCPKGNQTYYFCSGSPSDFRIMKKARSDIRRFIRTGKI